MAAPRTAGSGESEEPVPVARLVHPDETQENDDDIPVVVGEQVPTPSAVYAVGARASLSQPRHGDTVRPQSAPSSSVLQTGTQRTPGCGSATSFGGRLFGDERAALPLRSGGLSRTDSSKREHRPLSSQATFCDHKLFTEEKKEYSMWQTGLGDLPGCGSAIGVGGTLFRDKRMALPTSSEGCARQDSRTSSHVAEVLDDDLDATGDTHRVEDEGPILVACGHGQSIYDVKGCLSSWVLLKQRDESSAGEKGALLAEKEASIKGLFPRNKDQAPGKDRYFGRWGLRSESTAAGEGGVMCSACVPSDDPALPRMLLTGGKDAILREWEVMDGRPSLVSEIRGNTDWISGCALWPSTTPGAPPSVAISGGRDGCVSFWSKSRPSSAISYAAHLAPAHGGAASTPFRSGKGPSFPRSSGGGGSNESVGGGVHKLGGSVGGGGWSLTSRVSGSHGSSEFVTCVACPGGRSGANAGWVATGGTDWTVRLWDVVKARQLGRLSSKGHSNAVRSLAVSSDGNLLVSGGEDHKVVVWSPQSRRAISTLKGHESYVHGVATDPGTSNGQSPLWVASGGGEGLLFIWDPRNWSAPIETLLGEAGDSVNFLTGKLSRSSLDKDGKLRHSTGAKIRGESGRWEGDTVGASMLKSVNCLGVGAGGEWLFAGGETVVRSWRRQDGMWLSRGTLPGKSLGGVASISVAD